MSEIAWHLLQPVDTGAMVQQGFATGMSLVKNAQTQGALSRYVQNPDDPEAFGALARFDPQTAVTIRNQRVQEQQRQAQLIEEQRKREQEVLQQRQANIVAGGRILRQVNPQNDADYQQALQIAREAGVDISNAPPQFDPQWAKGVMAAAQALDPQAEKSAPASIQEYEYAKGQGFQGSYMDFQAANAPPMAVDNGDGTKTIYPRGYFSGQSARPPAPAPGAIPHSAVSDVLSGGGLPAPVVAGFLGNFHVEGGYYGAKGDGGTASGIAQWRDERQQTFQRIIGKPISQATPEEQAKFVLWEMQNPEAAGMTREQRDAILAAPDAETAAALIDEHYERSRGEHRGTRVAAAGAFARTGAVPVRSKAEFDALPSGAEFIAPDGSHRRKP